MTTSSYAGGGVEFIGGCALRNDEYALCVLGVDIGDNVRTAYVGGITTDVYCGGGGCGGTHTA